MRFKGRLQNAVPARLGAALPAGFQAIGSIAVLRLDPALQPYLKRIGREMHRLYPRFTAVVAMGAVRGELREPTARCIWGRSTRTVHVEHGIRYALDVRKVMLAKGNVAERHRIRPKQGEVIADFFAGIGYFSLPLAKALAAAAAGGGAGGRVYAIEKNPPAFRFLQENIRKNRLHSAVPVFGDCRAVRLPEPVDRVVLGYFPHTERFLPAAFRACADRASIHFHNCYRASELWEKPEQQLRAAARRAGFSVRVLNRRIIKTLSPSLRHVVLDGAVVRASQRRKSRAGHSQPAANARP